MKSLSVLAVAGMLAVGLASAHPAHVAPGAAAPSVARFVTPMPDAFGSILVDR